jgi:enoyl-CoA hydratase/carnithine racemase
VADFETITYTADDGIAWVTLNRPDVHNAFNLVMQHELRTVWRWLRRDDTVRVVVVTGAGEKAFCTGVDRREALGEGSAVDGSTVGGSSAVGSDAAGPDPASREPVHIGSPGATPFMFDDPGEYLGPKSNDLWKPVIAAVNGMACGGAFYLLGEVDIVIAAEHATFFDPHVTFGMASAYEPLQLLPKMPFGEIVRMTLLGNAERISAARAHEVGFVSEVCPAAELHDRAAWVAGEIAKAPALAVQGSLRALWAGRELSRRQSLDLGWAFIGLGTDEESLAEGQATFASGARMVPRIR